MLKVVGIGAKPLAGVTVRAFASSIPEEGHKSSPSDFDKRGDYPFPGERHASLMNTTAVSDAQGVAQFKGLTVTGTSDKVVYISFFANGKLLSWSNPATADVDLHVPTFKTPFFVNPNNTITVGVDVAPSAEVIEGRPFDQQPVVKVTPARAGRVVYAIVVAKDDTARPGKVTAPYGKPEIAIKRLTHPTAITDASGIARFDKLGFQSEGNTGSYHIEFWCEGQGSVTDALVTVTSSIARVEVRDCFESLAFKWKQLHRVVCACVCVWWECVCASAGGFEREKNTLLLSWEIFFT